MSPDSTTMLWHVDKNVHFFVDENVNVDKMERPKFKMYRISLLQIE